MSMKAVRKNGNNKQLGALEVLKRRGFVLQYTSVNGHEVGTACQVCTSCYSASCSECSSH